MADTAREAKALIALMAQYGMGTFEYRDDIRSIRIVNGSVEQETSSALPSEPVNGHSVRTGTDMVRSPGVGRFRRASAEPMPASVAKGEILGFITSGSLRLPVTAPQDCLLLSTCQPDEAAVGFDAPLFEIRTHS